MDARKKLQKFYESCSILPEEITRESMLEYIYSRFDRMVIQESLDAKALSDDALKALREMKFTYREIGELFCLRASALGSLRKRFQRLSVETF